jgi:hypothetical protein
MEQWNAVDAHNEGVEAQNTVVLCMVFRPGQWSQIRIMLMSRIRLRFRIKVKRRIRIRTKVKSCIRIRYKVMRIRNPEAHVCCGTGIYSQYVLNGKR